MSGERTVLVAPVELLLLTEPTTASRRIDDDDLPGVAQLLVDASVGLASGRFALESATDMLTGLLAGSSGEPRRDAWLGIWEDDGPPVSVIMCTTWQGSPYIAVAMTAPASRGRGYASSLAREIAQTFWTTRDSRVTVALDAGSPSIELFTELGFTPHPAAASVS